MFLQLQPLVLFSLRFVTVDATPLVNGERLKLHAIWILSHLKNRYRALDDSRETLAYTLPRIRRFEQSGVERNLDSLGAIFFSGNRCFRTRRGR